MRKSSPNELWKPTPPIHRHRALNGSVQTVWLSRRTLKVLTIHLAVTATIHSQKSQLITSLRLLLLLRTIHSPKDQQPPNPPTGTRIRLPRVQQHLPLAGTKIHLVVAGKILSEVIPHPQNLRLQKCLQTPSLPTTAATTSSVAATIRSETSTRRSPWVPPQLQQILLQQILLRQILHQQILHQPTMPARCSVTLPLVMTN